MKSRQPQFKFQDRRKKDSRPWIGSKDRRRIGRLNIDENLDLFFKLKKKNPLQNSK